jgi:hypothetical protein
MPSYKVTTPDGRQFKVTGDTPEQAQAAIDDLLSKQVPAKGPEPVGEPDPQMKEFAGEVLSGDPDRSRGAQLQADYNRMPAYQKPLVAADDIIRQAVDAGTGGYADKLAGKFSEATGIGPDTATRRQNTQDAYLRAPGAGTAAQIVGGVYGAGKALGAASALPGAGAVAKVAGSSIPARLAGGAAVGAGMGAVDAAGHDKDVGEGAAYGAAFGAGGQAVGEAVGGVVNRVAGAVGKKFGINQPKVRSQEELKDASQALYKSADEAGIIVKPEALQRLRTRIVDDLTESGYHPKINQEVAAVVDEIDRVAGGNATLKGVDVMRQIAGQAGGSPNAGTRRLAGKIIDKIDDFTDTLGDSDVIALNGDVKTAVGMRKEAQGLWASQRKSQLIEDVVDRAERRAAKGGAGANIDNAMRQEIDKVINNRKLKRGFSGEEIKVMKAIVHGAKGQNLARLVGKLSPENGGLMMWAHIMAGGTSAPLALSGFMAKRYADAATPRNVGKLDQMVRNGGVMPTAAPNATQRLAQRVRQPLGRGLGMAGVTLSEENQ